MEVQLSFRDMSWYLGIPYDYYDEDPEKWNNFIEMLDVKDSEIHCIYENDKTALKYLHSLKDKLHNAYYQLHRKIFSRVTGRFPTTDDGANLWMSDNDFDSDKRVIINYLPGSGGNFLSNCLYFNDSSGCMSLPNPWNPSLTRSSPLILEKPSYTLALTLDNIEEKLNYVISQTKNQSIWLDIFLFLNVHQQYHKILITKCHMQSIKKTLLFTERVHPNCKTIIYFKNTKLFRYLREYKDYILGINRKLNKNLDSNDSTNLTILQFIKKSQEKKKKIIDLCNDETQLYSFCNIDSKITFYMWDTNWFFSEGDTIDHIRELYELLSLPGFNDDAISKYYNAWIETMSDLKEKNTSIKH